MRLSDSVLEVLDKYKYSNLPLEETMQRLTDTSGYHTLVHSKSEDFAQLLCDYKWNKITKEELSESIKKLDCFQEVTMW